jgi:undecaprenyl-diphosphatase
MLPESTLVPTSRRAPVILFAVAAALFAALTAVVLANPSWLTSMDTVVTTEVAGTHNGALNRAMQLITLLGDRIVIGSLLVAVSVWAFRTGRCRTPVLVLIGAFLLNPVLEAVLKGLVGRSRPDIARLVTGDGPAFPSGHVLATVGFYGVLAVIAWRSTTRRGFAVGAMLSSALVIALVGFSRIYLGVHWMTDVVGGFLVGGAFVLAVAYFLRDHHFGRSLGCTRQQCKERRESQPVRVPSRRER